jgi:hypothetical protein
MPRLFAMLLAVPMGRIASGTPLPASARAASRTVPSPPAATTKSTGSSRTRSKSERFSISRATS